jgi:S1-C subfamily serine protease
MHFLAMSKIDLQKHLLAFVLLASFAPYQVARAQQPLHFPSPELAIPGVAEKSPISAPTIDLSGFAALNAAEAVATRFKDAIPRTRSAGDVILFRQAAPSVVLIRTKDGSGSGSLLQGNVILTGLHVVEHNRAVTVVFKPANGNGKPTADEVVTGDVVKVDARRDLALVRPRSLPRRSIRPLDISMQDIEVGADVHAIGHP